MGTSEAACSLGFCYKVVLEWFLLEGIKELEFTFSPLRAQRDFKFSDVVSVR